MFNGFSLIVFKSIPILLGAVALIFGARNIRKIIFLMNSHDVRVYWNFLYAAVYFFVVSYFSYIIFEHDNISEIVSVVFFFGGIFVWLISKLFLLTTEDIKRISKLEKESITDPLMNIYNRRYLDLRLEQELSRSKRNESNLSIILIDLDHFKNINDTYGHQVGDLVLRKFADILRSIKRTSDVLIRYGGEEILIIAPDSDLEDAVILCERISETLKHQKIQPHLTKTLDIKISASIGISQYSSDQDDMDSLIKRADLALYKAKSSGRDKIEIGII